MTISEFAMKIQKQTGSNIQFVNCNTVGQSHCPTVSITLVLPDGEEYEGYGSNQKIAKQNAVDNAIANIGRL